MIPKRTVVVQKIRILEGFADCSSIKIDPNDTVVVATHRLIKIWEIANGREIYQQKNEGGDRYKTRFSPSGKLFAVASNRGGLKIWRVTWQANEL